MRGAAELIVWGQLGWLLGFMVTESRLKEAPSWVVGGNVGFGVTSVEVSAVNSSNSWREIALVFGDFKRTINCYPSWQS